MTTIEVFGVMLAIYALAGCAAAPEGEPKGRGFHEPAHIDPDAGRPVGDDVLARPRPDGRGFPQRAA